MDVSKTLEITAILDTEKDNGQQKMEEGLSNHLELLEETDLNQIPMENSTLEIKTPQEHDEKRLPSQPSFETISETEKISEEKRLEKLQYCQDIGKYDLFMIPVALLLFCSDVLSDIFLGISYLVGRQWPFAILTIFVILLPGVINLYYDLDQKRETVWRAYAKNWYHWLWLPWYILFSMEVPVLYLQNWVGARKYLKLNSVPHKVDLLDKYHYTYRRISYVRTWEARLEAVPQLALQLYIMKEQEETKWHQSIAVITSLLGYAVTKFTLCKADNMWYNQRISFSGLLLYGLGSAIPVGCRSASVALALSVRPWWWIILPLICHFLFFSTWYWFKMPDYKRDRSVAGALLGGIQWLIEPYVDPTVHRSVSYALIYLMEDLYFLTIWTILVPKTINLILVSILIVLDISGRTAFCCYCIFKERIFIIPFQIK